MKRIISLLLPLLLILTLSVPVMASGPRIVDRADLLTDAQEETLEQKAQAISQEYGMDVVIVTVYDLEGATASAYADDYFDDNGYGIGSSRSGVLFLIALESQNWAISTSGETIYALTDYGIEQIFRSIAADLSSDRFYAAFDSYLDQLPRYFQAYQDGHPIDGNPDSGYNGPGYIDPPYGDDVVYYDPEPGISDVFRIIGVSLLIGAAVSVITILIMRSQMNTARSQKDAGSYLVSGSYCLRRSQDIFLYSRVTRSPRPKSNSGGGSSVHRGSSGRSHGGRSGGF